MPVDLTRPWPELPLAVFDAETTSADPKRCGVVQIAVVRLEQGRVVDRYVTLCRPADPIPPEATAIHGITDAMVESYLALPAYAGPIAHVARDALPVAYNERFDRRIVHRFFEGNDCPAWAMQQWVCPMVILKDVERVMEGKGFYKLASACKRWQIPLADAHDAGADAEATGLLLWRLYEAGKVKPCAAAKLLAHVARRAEAHEAYRAW